MIKLLYEKKLTQKDMEVIGSSTGMVNYGERVEVISRDSQSAIIRYQVSGGVKHAKVELKNLSRTKLKDLSKHELRIQLTSIYILWADAIKEKNRYNNHKEYPQKVKKLEELTQELKEVVQYVNDPNLDKVFKEIQTVEIKNLGTKQLDYLRVYCSIQDKTDLNYDGLAILHGVLDVVGMFGIDAADALNATIYFIEGKVTEGIFSLIGVVILSGINLAMRSIYLGEKVNSLLLKT